MDDTLVIRQAVPDDIPSVASMLGPMYRLRRSEEFLRWQCFDTVIPAVLMCSFRGSDIIGMFGIQKRKLTNGLLCGQASWLNIAPQWQGKGYFAKLGERAINYFKDLDILCVFANAGARYPCERSLGMKTIGSLKLLMIDAARVAPMLPDVLRHETIQVNTMFPHSLERKGGTVMFSYTAQYRLWRYALNPMHSYSLVTLENGDFAVVKLFFDPFKKIRLGDIVDYECPLRDRRRLTGLLVAACGFLKHLGAERITIWAIPGTEAHAAVLEIGFQADSYETYFGVKALKPECEYVYDLSQWHLRQADATNY